MNLWQWINTQLANGQQVFQTAVILIAAIVFFVVAIRVRFAVATTLITGLLCGVAIFFASGGAEWAAGLIKGLTTT